MYIIGRVWAIDANQSLAKHHASPSLLRFDRGGAEDVGAQGSPFGSLVTPAEESCCSRCLLFERLGK